MTSDCTGASLSLQIVIAMLAGLNVLFGTWLAHRRYRADLEREQFHIQMKLKHDLPLSGRERKIVRTGKHLGS